ncbi:MAG: glycosyltransferase [Candidatus Coatesbacteria bacterium]|nr:glycosyltransferase [Candidatus Coatesbacteria bacterium]
MAVSDPSRDVSIIIPVYNDENYIEKAINSALAQTHSDVEVVVVDDGSTDGTPDILDKFGGDITRIRRENGGLPAARNTGINASHGRYLCFLDSDDEFMPEKVREQFSFLEERPDAGLCYSGWLDVDIHDGRILRDFSSARDEPRPGVDVFPPHFPVFAALVRRHWVERIGGFDEWFLCAADNDFWWRLWAAGCTFRRLKGALAVRGVRPKSMSKHVPKHSSYVIAAYRKYFSLIGPKAGRSIRVRSLAGVWMKQAAHYLTIGDVESARTALASALRYDRRLLRERTYWLQLLTQLDLKYPLGYGEGISSFSKVWSKLKALIDDVLAEPGSSQSKPSRISEAEWALAFALSLHACNSRKLLQMVKWYIVGAFKGRGGHMLGFAWLLIRCCWKALR